MRKESPVAHFASGFLIVPKADMKLPDSLLVSISSHTRCPDWKNKWSPIIPLGGSAASHTEATSLFWPVPRTARTFLGTLSVKSLRCRENWRASNHQGHLQPPCPRLHKSSLFCQHCQGPPPRPQARLPPGLCLSTLILPFLGGNGCKAQRRAAAACPLLSLFILPCTCSLSLN